MGAQPGILVGDVEELFSLGGFLAIKASLSYLLPRAANGKCPRKSEALTEKNRAKREVELW